MSAYQPAPARRRDGTSGYRRDLDGGAARLARTEAEGRTTHAEGQIVRSLHRSYTWQAISEASGLTPYRLRQIADLWPEEEA